MLNYISANGTIPTWWKDSGIVKEDIKEEDSDVC